MASFLYKYIMEVEQLEHLAEMVYMSVEIRTEDQDIIDIYKTKRKVTKDLIHHPLEGVLGVPESKRKAEEFKHTKLHNDLCFLDVVFTHGHLIITFVQI